MLELLSFAESAEEAASQEGGSNWFTQYGIYIIFGLLLVGMILLMVIPQRKQKKRQEQMMAQLAVGSVVTTIGGIVGEVVQLDETHIWLLTGVGENKSTMQFVRQAIHSVAPAPGTPEAEAAEQAKKAKEDEVDEIK